MEFRLVLFAEESETLLPTCRGGTLFAELSMVIDDGDDGKGLIMMN
jgi:hypothetical protein